MSDPAQPTRTPEQPQPLHDPQPMPQPPEPTPESEPGNTPSELPQSEPQEIPATNPLGRVRGEPYPVDDAGIDDQAGAEPDYIPPLGQDLPRL
ncbi:hypothetical protein [Prosthecomicrobium pneumaticum]|uniref:Uncharacterized protein n=1 Tax=Prosthecomicrobium pneumaticum TaxID=81895 RepID=A0A7W9L3S9_9HYPH|nr:hypothetical protein [Prosthecomicrobium pneumaticum]MBB5754866.1 hypothetical protein [Prosthecomicrobium pneumaticum]